MFEAQPSGGGERNGLTCWREAFRGTFFSTKSTATILKLVEGSSERASEGTLTKQLFVLLEAPKSRNILPALRHAEAWEGNIAGIWRDFWGPPKQRLKKSGENFRALFVSISVALKRSFLQNSLCKRATLTKYPPSPPKEKHRIYVDIFEKFEWTFAFFHVTRVRNPTAIVQKNVFRWIFYLGSGFFCGGGIFLLFFFLVTRALAPWVRPHFTSHWVCRALACRAPQVVCNWRHWPGAASTCKATSKQLVLWKCVPPKN